MTGESPSSVGQEDLMVVKYDAAGGMVWSARYDGPAHGSDWGLAIAVADDGTVYVTGQSWGGATDFDLITIQYTAQGIEQWVNRYDGGIGQGDRGEGIGVDPQGGVFVTGWSTTGHDPYYGWLSEYITMRYAPDGNRSWIAHYTGPGSIHQDQPFDLAVDHQGDVVVTGSTYVPGLAWDFDTVKYRGSDGQELWHRRYDYGIGGIDEAHAIAVGPNDEVCVTGMSYTDLFDGLKQDAFTIVYDRDGTPVWDDRFNGPVNSIDSGDDIFVDSAGSVYITGSANTQTFPDYLTIKYSPLGQRQWVALYNGPWGGADFAHYVVVDPAGNTYVTGNAKYGNSLADIVTLKYDPDGRQIWIAAHGTPMNTNDFAAGIALNGANVVVAGTSSYVNEGTSWDAVTLGYPSGETTGIDEPAFSSSVSSGMAEPCPNPSAFAVRFPLLLSEARPVRVEILDAAGRRIQVLARSVARCRAALPLVERRARKRPPGAVRSVFLPADPRFADAGEALRPHSVIWDDSPLRHLPEAGVEPLLGSIGQGQNRPGCP